MATTIKALFPSRREVELAVEHLVQEYGIERTDIFIEPAGFDNSAGEAPAGADIESGHPGEQPDADGAAYEGKIQVSVDMNEDESEAVTKAFQELGAFQVSAN